MKTNKGQNIVEYILMAVAVILVFLVILNPKSGPVHNSTLITVFSIPDKIHQIDTIAGNLPP